MVSMLLARSVALWSFRHQMLGHLDEYLIAISRAGFTHVEIAGFLNRPTRDIPIALERTAGITKHEQLKVSCILAPLLTPESMLEKHLEWVATYTKAFDTKTVCLSYIPPGAITPSEQDYLLICDLLIRICRANPQVQFLYHCYDHEFNQTSNSTRGIDIISHNLKSINNFWIQLDTFWMLASKITDEDIAKLPRIRAAHIGPVISQDKEGIYHYDDSGFLKQVGYIRNHIGKYGDTCVLEPLVVPAKATLTEIENLFVALYSSYGRHF